MASFNSKKNILAGIIDSPSGIDLQKADLLLDKEIAKSNHKIIVLDDDPTGAQTVHDVSLYLNWSNDCIEAGFDEPNRLFYILTNSRSKSSEEAENIYQKAAERIIFTSKRNNRPFILISRSDSTLRGHYPLETETLRKELESSGIKVDGEIFCPYFMEGGRVTVNDIHYVRYGTLLVPAAETEFARNYDAYKYQNSYLPDFIEERTQGKYKAKNVVTISLEMIRAFDIEGIEQKLMQASNFSKIVVNALREDDLKVFSIALYRAFSKGKYFIIRSAASFVKVFGGVSTKPLLFKSTLIHEKIVNGGIVVVGSLSDRTTAQLENLLRSEYAAGIEVNSDLVLESDEAFKDEIKHCISKAESYIKKGKTAVCYTKRTIIRRDGDSPDVVLKRSAMISNGLQQLVGGLRTKPSFVIAKGGITASDIASEALKIRKAYVMGAIMPGVPVWRTGSRSKFPGIPYILFPGNVGEEYDLRYILDMLHDED